MVLKGFFKNIWQNRAHVMMALPAFLILLFIMYIPMTGLVMAFKNFDYSKGIFGSDWVGLGNFEFLIKSKDTFLTMTRNTVLYYLLFTVVGTVLNVTIAICIDQLAFKKMGKTYEAPTLVLFSGSVQSGCGGANASTGPFYCSADQCVYIDLSFFTSMKSQLGSDGDFAYAYVIAHEVGHHVQYLLGTLGKAHEQMSKLSQSEANKISVQLELQADNYAGVWAHHEQKMFGSLEDGDLQEALGTAQVIGDDYLQKKAQGYVVPESFNHGTSQQRMKWFKRGFDSGDIAQGNTFAYSYENL